MSERLGRWQVVWSPEFGVGVGAMDDDHRHLIDLFNRLAAPEMVAKPVLLPELLADLGNYAEAHFHREEALMGEFPYPAMAEHRVEHGRLLDEYGAQIDDWHVGRISPVTMSRFFYSWLMGHIMTHDVALANSIRAYRETRE